LGFNMSSAVDLCGKRTQIGEPAPALQQRLERAREEYERCDTVIVGIHVRYGGVEFATDVESERVFKHNEERSKLDAFNDQYVLPRLQAPRSYVGTALHCGLELRALMRSMR
jgi:hypothetical protein